MGDQLKSRFFKDMPSETRLVQLYMSKQTDVSKVLPAEWLEQAKAFYLVWLRNAANALNMGRRVSPNRSAKRKYNKVMLFDGLDEPLDADPPGAAETGAGSDSVIQEAKRWENLSRDRVQPFIDSKSGMLDEFKLLFSLRAEFPLHFHVFRRTAVHISAEANAEDTFSLAGSLSDDNTHTGPDFLSRLTRTNKNRKRCDPPAKSVLAKYLVKFHAPPANEDVQNLPTSDDDSDSHDGDDGGSDVEEEEEKN